jgi:hypothetical protein
MNTTLTAATVSACLFGAIALGIWLRRVLPEHHLSGDTRQAVKLAMGLVATMSALVLGLLVSSAKGAFDAERTQVIQMAAKIAFLDRVLAFYGPDAAEARAQLRAAVEEVVRQIWPEEKRIPARLAPEHLAGVAVYNAIQRLSPRDDTQHSLKTQATTLAMEVGQLRSLLVAQSAPSISEPLLVVVVSWLVVIFFSFSLFAPSNATATLALIVSAFAVAGAIFLILELDRPFGGLIRISSEPMVSALNQLGK